MIAKTLENVVQLPTKSTNGIDMAKLPEWRAITILEASDLSGYHPEWLRQLCRDGKLEYVKLGNLYLIKYDDFMDYLNKAQSEDDARHGPRKSGKK